MYNENLRESLAALAHEQWASWMRWMFDKSGVDRQGNCVIPRELYKRWYRQMRTSYDDLSEEEKDSGRKEADEFMSQNWIDIHVQDNGDMSNKIVTNHNVLKAHEFYVREAKNYEIDISTPEGDFIMTDYNYLSKPYKPYVEIDPNYQDKYYDFVDRFGDITTFYKLYVYSAFRFDVADFEKIRTFELSHGLQKTLFSEDSVVNKT